MAAQKPWTEREAAILLEALIKVLNGDETRKNAIKQVSEQLRREAVESGITIDEIYRNENGITFQMHSMESAYRGYTVVKPATQLFARIVSLRKTDPTAYNQLLKGALGTMSNKDRFSQWLSANPSKKYSADVIINALEKGSAFCLSRSLCRESFWDMTEISKFNSIASKLLGMRIFRLTDRNTAVVLDKVVPMYREFLKSLNVEEGTEPVIETTEMPYDPEVNPKDMRDSLAETIEYLKTRYDVRLHYDHFVEPSRYSNDLLYKVKNSKKDIMWVYYIDSRTSHYISVETEPEYLTGMRSEPKGFTRIQLRSSHPCQKMFFEEYSAIKDSLIDICDSIDSHFSADASEDADENRVKLYRKLYYFSKVYDDPDGLTIDKIISMLGNDADKRLVKSILEDASWATRISDNVYSFSKNPVVTLREPRTPYTVSGSKYISDSAFYNYLLEKAGMAEATCRSYVSAIRTAENYAQSNNYTPWNLYNSSPEEAVSLMQKLLNDSAFMDYNAQQHNRFRAAFTKLAEMTGQEIGTGSKTAGKAAVQPQLPPSDYDKDKFVQTLLRRYRNGMQFDSIDFENFRETYSDLFDQELTFDDAELEERLRYCGVLFKDRLFPAEGIIDSATKEKLFSYIENSFSSGKTILYYKAIYQDLSDVLAYCFSLTDEMMLKAYIEFEAEDGKYFFFNDYMSVEKEVRIDHAAEIANYLLSAGKPLSFDDIYAGLSHISSDLIYRETQINPDFLRNEKSHYFHIGIFEVSQEEADQISAFIANEIEEDGYAIWSRIFVEIQEEMPVFLENNLYLSSLGIRNALARKLEDRFNFDSEVISASNKHLNMSDVYSLYAHHHAPFSDIDLYNFSKEIGTVIYFGAVAEETVRVSKELFVPKTLIEFDIGATDKALETYLSDGYILVKDVDSFLVFPNVGFEWNAFLLESYLIYYSKKFALVNNGTSLNNVAGAVVKRGGAYSEFVDICADALANSDIELKKDTALDYLALQNLITRRSYRDVDVAITKARQIRNRKV